jgi:uncharacterized protein with PIN domain
MTLDAAALITIVRQAPGWETLVARTTEAGETRVPATALAEAGMVLVAQEGLRPLVALSDVVRTLNLTVVPFTERDWLDAVLEYDRRRGSCDGAARMGDCLSAVVARRTGNPIATLTKS